MQENITMFSLRRINNARSFYKVFVYRQGNMTMCPNKCSSKSASETQCPIGSSVGKSALGGASIVENISKCPPGVPYLLHVGVGRKKRG